MSYTHHDTGKSGESLATAWLQQQGYAIICRNWRDGRYEMDIIASKDKVLHFVEVKTRRSDVFGFPEEHVSKAKIKRMLRVGAAFQYRNPAWKVVQYDILSITWLKGQEPEFFLIEDVYI